MTKSKIQTHQLSVIDPAAKLGKGVIVDPFSIIHEDVEIGAGTHIGSNVTLYPGVRIGTNCRILPNSVLSTDPNQLKYWSGTKTTSDQKSTGIVTIGNNVHIESGVTIHGESHISDDCWIGSNVVIHDGAHIGKGCKIFPGAVLSSIPQDLKFQGERTTLEVGENTTIREFATLNRGTTYNMKTVVGKNCLIMAYAHVAHDCIIGDHVILANAVNMAGHVEIDDFAIIGGMTAIHQFVRIGKHVMISGGSLVRKDVPPYIVAAREPLQYQGINTIGLRRRGFDNETIRQLQDIYRFLFRSGMNNTDAIEAVKAKVPVSKDRTSVLKFYSSASRGVIKGHVINTNGNGHSKYESNGN